MGGRGKIVETLRRRAKEMRDTLGISGKHKAPEIKNSELPKMERGVEAPLLCLEAFPCPHAT